MGRDAGIMGESVSGVALLQPTGLRAAQWRSADFQVPAVVAVAPDFWEPDCAAPGVRRRHAQPSDFWQPSRPSHTIASQSSPRPIAGTVSDFWEPACLPAAPLSPSLSASPGSAWWNVCPLPAFGGDLRRALFVYAPITASRATRTDDRARWLVGLLDIPSRSRHAAYRARFAELFDAFPHAATFRTLSGLALNGADADDLLTAFALRQLWMGTPLWWSFRSPKSGDVVIPIAGATLLGWSQALRFVEQHHGGPADCIIADDWIDDWLALPWAHPASWRFIDYAAARLRCFAAGQLDLPEGSSLRQRRVPRTADDMRHVVNNASRTASLLRTDNDGWQQFGARSQVSRPIAAALEAAE